MAIVSNNTEWASIANQIKNFVPNLFNRSERYFDGFNYSSVNPLVNVFPLTSSVNGFFGTKTFNIVIIGRPYGWVNTSGSWNFSWPPAGYESALNQIRNNFEQWSKYQVLMYGDGWLVQKAIAADPVGGGVFANMMQQTFGKMQSECAVNADVGFEWKGVIPSQVTAEYFLPVIEAFYNE
jgi:hypothetical protein